MTSMSRPEGTSLSALTTTLTGLPAAAPRTSPVTSSLPTCLPSNQMMFERSTLTTRASGADLSCEAVDGRSTSSVCVCVKLAVSTKKISMMKTMSIIGVMSMPASRSRPSLCSNLMIKPHFIFPEPAFRTCSTRAA